MKRNVHTEISIKIRPDFVLRRLGYGKTRPAPDNIHKRLTGIIAEAGALIEPKLAYIEWQCRFRP